MPRSVLVQHGRPYPFLPVRVVVRNPDTARQSSFDVTCRVDTGFSHDIWLPHGYLPEIQRVGVRIYESRRPFTTAEGQLSTNPLCCLANVERVHNYVFPSPGIEINLMICRNPNAPSLFGLRLLSKWIAEFDGPQQLLSLISEE